MAVELRVPAVGESITEVVVAAWRKAAGEPVRRDETVAELETDKATIELPAPADGMLGPILKPAGASAAVGEVIGSVVVDAAAVAAAGTATGAKAAAAPAAKPAAAPAAATGRAAPAAPAPAVQPAPPATAAHAPPSGQPGEGRVMPAARRLLAEHGVPATAVPASGPGGRLLKEDVVRQAGAAAAAGPAGAAGGAGAAAGAADGAAAGERRERAVPLSPLRKRVAERLLQAQQQAALLTTFNEIEMTALLDVRRRHQEAFQQRHGVKLGIVSFFVRAVIEALREFPQLNAEIRGDDLVYRDYYDIGIAVGAGKGLAVPVLRDAGCWGLARLELAIADFAARAQQNKLELAELQGGTFTISNGGVYGSLLSTPIVNPPQSGILGLHAIQERPVARDGQVVIRPMMYVALTYDHRVVDGREAVTFLRRIKEGIEAPERLLLQI